jgi:MFS transporter, PHS family, inorganic phosphate transporter
MTTIIVPPLVWRIIVGVSLVPAFGTLYQRLTLGESTRFAEARARAVQNEEDNIGELKRAREAELAAQEAGKKDAATESSAPSSEELGKGQARAEKKSQLGGKPCFLPSRSSR